MSPKKCISIVLLLVLLVTAPFSIVYADGDDTASDYQYINAYQFFLAYNLTSVNSTDRVYLTYSSGTGIVQGYIYDNGFGFMSVPNGGSFNRYSSYNSNNRLRLTHNPTYIVFISNTNITSNNIVAYPQSGSVTATRITNDRLTVNSPNKMYLIVIKAYNNASSGTVYTTLDFTNATSSTSVLPLFVGTEDVMNDDIHRLVFGNTANYSVSDSQLHTDLTNVNNNISQGFGNTNTKLTEINTGINTLNQATANIFSKVTSIDNKLTDTNNYLYEIKNGNNVSNSSVSDNDQQNETLSDSITDLVSQEDSFLDSMDSSLQNVQMNNSIITNNHFLTSANWVRQQYNSMISNNPFGSLLYLCLSLGLSLLILGKLR